MYSYERTGVFLLPIYEPEQAIGVGTSRATTRTLPDGSRIRSYGSGRAPVERAPITRTARLIESSPEALAVAYDRLRGLVGTVDRLYRHRIDGAMQWMLAEMNQESGQTSHATLFRHLGQWAQDVPLTFTPLGPVWNGLQHGVGIPNVGDSSAGAGVTGTHDTDVFALSNTTMVVSNGGNAPVNHVVLRVTAGTAALTAFTLTCGRAKWAWSGSVAAGQVLVIDTAAQRVLNNGVANYSGFVRDVAHTLDAWNWLRLEPGANSVVLSGVVGGGTGKTISINFFDGFA